MKYLALACVLILAGCASEAEMTAEVFSPGDATEVQFKADGDVCKAEAEHRRDLSLQDAEVANADKQHVIYNRAFAACMFSKGYRERTSFHNLWSGYDL
jgi:ABC-type uncharacterized transport system auxiliary subunit